MKQKQQS